MKINKYILAGCLSLGLLFSSCDDFLDTEPRDFQAEKNYFKSKEDFIAAANALHTNTYAWNQGNDSYPILFDYGSDIISASDGVGNGTNVSQATDKYWKQHYKWLRQTNQLIAKGEVYDNQDEIAGPVGQAYFFRAWYHFFLLQRFGGVPLAIEVPDMDSEVVWGKRNSRYEVAAQIMNDLDVAIAKLKASGTTAKGINNDGHITMEAAQALKARVCLFEGTWEKYVGDKTDGDGQKEGAGKEKPANYPSVEQMLTMAKDLSRSIMDSGAFSLWMEVEEVPANIPNGDKFYANTSYFYLFNLEDAASNPMGVTKATDRESIFRSVFDYVNRKGNMNISHTKPAGPTRKLMDMFLCKDGLPPHLSKYKPDYTSMKSEFQNRDYRLTSCVQEPFKRYWNYDATGCPTYFADLTQLSP